MKSNLIKATAFATLILASANAKADGVSEALDGIGDFATTVGAGAAAVIGVAIVFAAIKLGKRLIGKI